MKIKQTNKKAENQELNPIFKPLPLNKNPVQTNQTTVKNMITDIVSISAGDLFNHLTMMIEDNVAENDVMNLKMATAYLNSKIRAPYDFMFAGESLSFPSNILNASARDTLMEEIILRATEENIQYFFDQSLSNLCENMNKKTRFAGDLIMLQLIANTFPKVCVNNLARNAILRNSYQNQSAIGLTLLWAMGE